MLYLEIIVVNIGNILHNLFINMILFSTQKRKKMPLTELKWLGNIIHLTSLSLVKVRV